MQTYTKGTVLGAFLQGMVVGAVTVAALLQLGTALREQAWGHAALSGGMVLLAVAWCCRKLRVMPPAARDGDSTTG